MKIIGAFILGFGIVLLGALLTAIFVRLAWNYSMPHIFNLPTISYLQAYALSILSGMLLKSTIKVNNND